MGAEGLPKKNKKDKNLFIDKRESPDKASESVEREREELDKPAELAESIDKDPRFINLKEERIAIWEKLNGSRYGADGIFSPEFKSFLQGNKKDNEPSLEEATLADFAERYPDDAKGYTERKKIETRSSEARNKFFDEGPEVVDENKERQKNIREKIKSEKQKESEKQERFKLKRDLDRVGEDFVRISSIFRKRDEDQLYSLLDKNDYSKIAFGARSLSESVNINSNKINYEEIEKSFRTILRGLEPYGTYKRPVVEEDPDSLGAISVAVRGAGEGLRELRSLLAQSAEKDLQKIVPIIDSLNKRLENIWLFTARQREALRRYLEG